MNTLKIKDYTFPVDKERSFIKEYNHEDFGQAYTVWDLWIQTAKAPFVDGELQDGNIRCEEMIATRGNLQSLAGKTILVEDSYDYITDEHLFSFYMLTHNGVKNNEITFEKIEGNQAYIHWKGVIEELGFDGEYNTDVPFELSCAVEIREMVDAANYQTPSTEVQKLIDTADDDFDNNQYIIDMITDITDHHRLDDKTYMSIIDLVSSESFIVTFEDDTDGLREFIENITYYTDNRTIAVPKSIAQEALARWSKVPALAGIIEDL